MYNYVPITINALRQQSIEKAIELKRKKELQNKKSVIDVCFSKPRTEDLENVPAKEPKQKKFFPQISKANLGDEIF